eukprot:TRINITY_DN8505_c0_g1_i1.p1 TRINITY_DN8505_c0_g1~~TRINITY_DN8505_c0_g1_i1.p1  ORF type:complete len:447 (+),score=106.50 TRINITY_DN8505_c0_g1_i1:81-1421(+)
MAEQLPLLYSGWLKKKGGKSLGTQLSTRSEKRRWIELRAGSLEYFVSPGGVQKGVIPIDKATKVRPASTFSGFIVFGPRCDREYELTAESGVEREKWLQAIAGAVRGMEQLDDMRKQEDPVGSTPPDDSLRTRFGEQHAPLQIPVGAADAAEAGGGDDGGGAAIVDDGGGVASPTAAERASPDPDDGGGAAGGGELADDFSEPLSSPPGSPCEGQHVDGGAAASADGLSVDMQSAEGGDGEVSPDHLLSLPFDVVLQRFPDFAARIQMADRSVVQMWREDWGGGSGAGLREALSDLIEQGRFERRYAEVSSQAVRIAKRGTAKQHRGRRQVALRQRMAAEQRRAEDARQQQRQQQQHEPEEEMATLSKVGSESRYTDLLSEKAPGEADLRVESPSAAAAAAADVSAAEEDVYDTSRAEVAALGQSDVQNSSGDSGPKKCCGCCVVS